MRARSILERRVHATSSIFRYLKAPARAFMMALSTKGRRGPANGRGTGPSARRCSLASAFQRDLSVLGPQLGAEDPDGKRAKPGEGQNEDHEPAEERHQRDQGDSDGADQGGEGPLKEGVWR